MDKISYYQNKLSKNILRYIGFTNSLYIELYFNNLVYIHKLCIRYEE